MIDILLHYSQQDLNSAKSVPNAKTQAILDMSTETLSVSISAGTSASWRQRRFSAQIFPVRTLREFKITRQ